MITLTDSIEIEATPEDVFGWFKKLRTGEDYRAWHPNHVEWYWVKGEPFQEGSVAYCEEYIHEGNKDKLRFTCTRVVPNRLIEYKPSFPISMVMAKSRFDIEPKGEGGCVLIAAISFRDVPFLGRLFHKQLEGLKQHMKEEGENLKRILEGKESG